MSTSLLGLRLSAIASAASSIMRKKSDPVSAELMAFRCGKHWFGDLMGNKKPSSVGNSSNELFQTTALCKYGSAWGKCNSASWQTWRDCVGYFPLLFSVDYFPLIISNLLGLCWLLSVHYFPLIMWNLTWLCWLFSVDYFPLIMSNLMWLCWLFSVDYGFAVNSVLFQN